MTKDSNISKDDGKLEWMSRMLVHCIINIYSNKKLKYECNGEYSMLEM